MLGLARVHIGEARPSFFLGSNLGLKAKILLERINFKKNSFTNQRDSSQSFRVGLDAYLSLCENLKFADVSIIIGSMANYERLEACLGSTLKAF